METDYSKVSEVKLTYSNKVKASDRMQISCSKDLYIFLNDFVYDKETMQLRESFKMVLLNSANKVLGYSSMFEGGTNSTLADIRMIMQTTLLSNATSIIISHNHPSGQLNPSNEDITLTRKVKEACDLFAIRFLDHIIMTDEGYYSFADEGRI